ncbi:type II toxin-antitoxin system HicB family antitoxin [Candidatus Microgenomates bacterium]|nr:type II toxin-antitoxin system HicB family antitoxin [Candidatus Microgenomates bacterium]
MQKQVLNYRVIIEPEKMGKRIVYNAACPTLGVYDYGDSIDEVLKSIKDGIELAIEVLRDEGKEIPVDDTEKGVVVATQVEAPSNIKLAAV